MPGRPLSSTYRGPKISSNRAPSMSAVILIPGMSLVEEVLELGSKEIGRWLGGRIVGRSLLPENGPSDSIFLHSITP